MKLTGSDVDISKEQLEQGVRVANALLAVAGILKPEHAHSGLLGSAIGIAFDHGSTREDVHKFVDAVFDCIQTDGARMVRTLKGSDLRVVPNSFSQEEVATLPGTPKSERP